MAIRRGKETCFSMLVIIKMVSNHSMSHYCVNSNVLRMCVCTCGAGVLAVGGGGGAMGGGGGGAGGAGSGITTTRVMRLMSNVGICDVYIHVP